LGVLSRFCLSEWLGPLLLWVLMGFDVVKMTSKRAHFIRFLIYLMYLVPVVSTNISVPTTGKYLSCFVSKELTIVMLEVRKVVHRNIVICNGTLHSKDGMISELGEMRIFNCRFQFTRVTLIWYFNCGVYRRIFIKIRFWNKELYSPFRGSS